MENERFSEKIQKAIRRPNNVVIPIKFPIGLFQDFDEFCKQETGDCYWLGIRLLLKFYHDTLNSDLKSTILFEKISKLEQDVNSLREDMALKKPASSKEWKHFGG